MIYIPKTIKVGYQERRDTYTGKLAYVIYYDEKNKLRKETSWNNWREKNIESNDFENTPTEGFVLNKKVGDYSDGWNHRQSYCRVYDPRGFEFEITIENLLFILERCNSIKGKGLEGQFVYSWDGKDLLLLPVDSPDYKKITEYSNKLENGKKFKSKDMIIGATYLTKDNKKVVYMGKYKEWHVKYINAYDKIYKPYSGKRFWFCNLEKSKYKCEECKFYYSFFTRTNLDSIIEELDNKSIQDYAERFEDMESKNYYSPYDKTKNEIKNMSYEDFKNKVDKIKTHAYNHDFYCAAKYKDDYHDFRIIFIKDINKLRVSYIRDKNGNKVFNYELPYYINSCYYNLEQKEEKIKLNKEYQDKWTFTAEEFYDKFKPSYVNKYLKNGKFYKKDVYLYE